MEEVADEPAHEPLVQAVLSAIPAGCTWLRAVHDETGRIVDFRIAAAGEGSRDIYGRGSTRVGARLAELYPSMVGGPLWQLYEDVLTTGKPARLTDFRYEEKLAGIVAESLFDVSAAPLLDGLLIWWERIDEDLRRLNQTELLGRLGWSEYDLTSGAVSWSPGMYRIFDRDPDLGPLPRSEQAAAVLADDRGISEAAWQTLDSGAMSDVTVRFQIGASVKHLRILSDLSHDADGTPLKVYGVVQDVTARVDSSSEIDRLRDQLRTREITALAEHRLAAQLQNMIQPVPRDPILLHGLEATVSYVPAESAVRVGGDWYHAQALPDGRVVLAIGDVAGHGLEAASGMAHLRYGLVAWVSIGIHEPESLVEQLNRLCCQLGITASAAVAVYDPTPKTLRWARGGHMPPLLGRAGRAEALACPAGMLLGVNPNFAYDAASAPLETGDLLLFYTDGLVERRPDGGLGLLAAVSEAVAAAAAGPAEGGLAALQAQLNYSNPDDDTCTLAIRVLPEPARR